MSAEISEDTSKRITALRFLLMVLVVFAHNNFTAESIAESVANGALEVVFNPNGFSVWVQLFISGKIANCAVPLFFLFAAYLQAKKADAYGTLLKKRAKSLLVPYILWIVIYAVYLIAGKLVLAKLMPQVLAHPDKTMFTYRLADWIALFFGYGKYMGIVSDNNPVAAGQFWFVRDLMILIVISPIIIRLIKKFPIGFFCVTTIFCLLGIPLYFVSTSGLFFYMAGLYWGLYDAPLFEKIDRISWIESGLLCLFSLIAGQLFFKDNPAMSLCLILSACVVMLKFSRIIASHQKVFAVASYLAGFSFFLYAIHMPALIILLKRLWLHFFPMKNAFFCLFEYFGVSLLTIAIGTGIGIALKKICPPVFRLLSGGR